MLTWIGVAIRILANPFSNVFQKMLTRRAVDPLSVVCATHLLLSLTCLPVLLSQLPPLSWDFWWNICVSAGLCVMGNALIVLALQKSDLSVLGPINAYKSVVSLIPGLILLGEFPVPIGLAGIALIVAGSYFLVDQRRDEAGASGLKRLLSDQGIQFRIAALVCSAVEAVFLKRAILASSWVVTFAYWSLLGLAISLAVIPIAIGIPRALQSLHLLNKHRYVLVMLFATTGLMQLSTNYVLQAMPVGYALALFQTSTIVSVVLGYHLFQEQHFLRRLIGSVIMVTGAVLVILVN